MNNKSLNKDYVFQKSNIKIATEGEYIGEFIHATSSHSTKNGKDYIIIEFKVTDDEGNQYSNLKHWFQIGKDELLLNQFIDALDCDGVSLAELNRDYQHEYVGFKIKDNVTPTQTYHNIISFWNLDAEDELEEGDYEEDDDSEEEVDDFDENDNPNWNNTRATRSSKRRGA